MKLEDRELTAVIGLVRRELVLMNLVDDSKMELETQVQHYRLMITLNRLERKLDTIARRRNRIRTSAAAETGAQKP